MAAERRTVQVEIEPGSTPIAGRVVDEAGARPFRGWLELALALEGAPPDEEVHAP